MPGGSAARKQSLCAESNEQVLQSPRETGPFKSSGRSVKRGFASLPAVGAFSLRGPHRADYNKRFFFFFALLVKLRIFLADLKALETNPISQCLAHSRHSIKLC